MTSKINARSPRDAQNSGAAIPSANNSYSPSVPISIYREVANELQATKITIDSIKLQNQQLLDQNQKLRVEIERVVQSALQLRQTADSQNLIGPAVASQPLPDLEVHFETPPVIKSVSAETSIPFTDEVLDPANTPKSLFTEQEPPSRHSIRSERSSEVGGWWLMLVICMIVITAFGTGFLIVRPLLPQR